MALTQVESGGIKDDAVTAGKIPANAVGSSEIADDAVGSAQIADDAIVAAAIADDAIVAAAIADDAVGAAAIADDAVTSAAIADDAVGAAAIADNAVVTAAIADNAVGLAQLTHGTDGELITYDASGVPAHVATGNASQILTSNGAGQPPTFQAAPASGIAFDGATANGLCTRKDADEANVSSSVTLSGTVLNKFDTGYTLLRDSTNTANGSIYQPLKVGGSNHVSNYGVGIGFVPEGSTNRTKIALVAEGTGQGYDLGNFHVCIASSTDGTNVDLDDKKLTVTKDGYVQQPSKKGAAFCARQTNTANYSANAVIIYNSDGDSWNTFDIGNNYSTSTGKYTAPVDGVYYFEGQAMTTGWSNGNTTQDLMSLRCNHGVISNSRQRRSRFDSNDDWNGYYTNSAAGTVKLSAGNTVWMTVNRSCGVSNTQYSYFTGWLIG